MTTPPLDKPKTAREELVDWLRLQKEQHGLIDFKVFFSEDAADATAEKKCAAILGMLRSLESGCSDITTDL